MLKNDFLFELASVIPETLQEEWDNSGVQINLDDCDIDKALVALEVTPEVVDEAIEGGFKMIITHHPLFFNPVKSIDTFTGTGDMAARLISAGISVYSVHTNFDKIEGGNNDYLASVLGLDEVETIGGNEITRMGYIDDIRFGDLIEGVEGIHSSVGDLDTVISTVGLCTGAGAEYIELAALFGCDLFVTGDVKYHEARLAEELGICVLDLGHYGTEKYFPKAFIRMMKENGFNEIEFVESKRCNSPFNE